MLRRAILATVLVTFANTGFGLLFAGPPTRSSVTGPSPERKRYLNPLGLALSADGLKAYVALCGVDAIAEVDLVSGRTLRHFATGRNPREVRRDGSIITVTDYGPGFLTVNLANSATKREQNGQANPNDISTPTTILIPSDQKGLALDLINLSIQQEPAWDSRHEAVTLAVFENQLTGVLSRGGAISPNAKAGVLGFGGGTAFSGALGFAGGNVGYGSIASTKRELAQSVARHAVGGMSAVTASLDRVIPAAQPSAIVWDSSFKTIFVAAAGSDAIFALSPNGLRTNLNAAATKSALAPSPSPSLWGIGPSVAEAKPPADLVRLRMPTQSNPRRLALSEDGRLLVASNMLSDSLTAIAIGPGGARVVKHIPLGGPEPDAARRGEILFNSARLSFNGRFACSSCHPSGDRDDRIWNTPTEDPGFARRTKSLLGVRDTAPYGWHGDSITLADRVKKTLSKLHKHSPKPEEIRDLVAYLESLDPPTALPVEEKDAEIVAQGRELFEGAAKCSRCHSNERMSDGKLHDVGTGGMFDTPSLRGIGRRTHLLHTGVAQFPIDIFLNLNQYLRHGAAHELDKQELEALMAYLKTL